MSRIERPAKDFKALCTALGYRKRTVDVVCTESVQLQGLNWEGGSRNSYHAWDIETGAVASNNRMHMPHPMNNEYEGSRIALKDGRAIVRTGVFLGNPSKMVIYVHPSNMPRFLNAVV